MLTYSQTSKRIRSGSIAEMLYGPEYKEIWTDHPPTPSDVSEWLREQRKVGLYGFLIEPQQLMKLPSGPENRD